MRHSWWVFKSEHEADLLRLFGFARNLCHLLFFHGCSIWLPRICSRATRVQITHFFPSFFITKWVLNLYVKSFEKEQFTDLIIHSSIEYFRKLILLIGNHYRLMKKDAIVVYNVIKLNWRIHYLVKWNTEVIFRKIGYPYPPIYRRIRRIIDQAKNGSTSSQ